MTRKELRYLHNTSGQKVAKPHVAKIKNIKGLATFPPKNNVSNSLEVRFDLKDQDPPKDLSVLEHFRERKYQSTYTFPIPDG